MEVRNYLIDSIRLIAALFVIIVHLPFENYNYELAVHIRLISRWAVPVFFMISGYFLSVKIKDDNSFYVKYISKLLGVIVISTILYMPLALNSRGLGYFIYEFDWFFLGSYFHLWFLSALLFSTLVYMFFSMNKMEKVLNVLSICLLLFFVIIMGYGYVFNITINQNVPMLYISIFFFNFGTYLNYFFSNTKKSKIISILLLFFGLLIQELEVVFLDGKSSYDSLDFQMLFGTIFLSIGIIGCCFSFRQASNNWLSEYGKRYGLFIYIYHVFLVKIIKPYELNFILLIMPFIIISLIILIAKLLENHFNKIYKILNGQFS